LNIVKMLRMTCIYNKQQQQQQQHTPASCGTFNGMLLLLHLMAKRCNHCLVAAAGLP
jgi:hypothetical protein